MVPEPERKMMIEAGHDHAGHLGARKTRKMVENQFHWPRMASQITQYCWACSVCLRYDFKRTKRNLYTLYLLSLNLGTEL